MEKINVREMTKEVEETTEENVVPNMNDKVSEIYDALERKIKERLDWSY